MSSSVAPSHASLSRYAGLFNPENIFIAKEGGGAGNNWAKGYAHAEQVQEETEFLF